MKGDTEATGHVGPAGPAGAGSQVVVMTGSITTVGQVIPVPDGYTTDQCKVLLGFPSEIGKYGGTITYSTNSAITAYLIGSCVYTEVTENSDKKGFTVSCENWMFYIGSPIDKKPAGKLGYILVAVK